MISSSANNKIKQVMNLAKKARARKEEGLFVAEGTRMFAELPKDRIAGIFVSESFMKDGDNRALIKDDVYEEVRDDVFKTMSDTQSPQGILALVKQYSYTLEEILAKPGPAFLLLLETIQDPGNLGTMIRAGEGAGITGVIMNDRTADIYNPKVIRSTMGSVCRVPFLYTGSWKETVTEIRRGGVHLYAAHLEGSHPYENMDYTQPVGFFIGNEASGLTEETAAMAEARVKIPMLGRVESLNAATASSVLMFETARQRRIPENVRKL